MRIIHLADIHYGINRHSKMNARESLPEITLLCEDYLSQVVNYAVANDADFFVVCGDVFHSSNPTTTMMKRFAKMLKPLIDHKIQIVMIAGNHDLPRHEARSSPVDLFSTIAEIFTEGAKTFIHTASDKPEYVELESKRGEKARFYLLPYIHPMKALKVFERGEGKASMDSESVRKIWEEVMTEQVNRFITRGAKLGKADASILCGHLATDNAVMGELDLLVSAFEEALPISVLQKDFFDYVALGHAHRHQVVSNYPPAVYSGAIHHVSFNEEGEEKGFIDLTIENGEAAWKFVKLDVREYTTIQVNTVGSKDPTAKIIEEIEKVRAQNEKRIKGAVVRLIVTIEAEYLKYVNYNKIYGALKDASFCLKPDFKVVGEMKEDLAIPQELGPMQALREYLESKNLDKEEVNAILALGEEIIREVEERG
ncbi:MAG: exonuclease SbcCD subunit D [Candidatus Freyarchaeota archaeon]